MSSLFPDEAPDAGRAAPAPLAERMRPRTFDEFVGQQELLAPGMPLREAIERDLLQSIILWGPPGTGKTTLARIIADTTRARFVSFSAVLAGIKEIREVMADAERLRRATGRRTIVFIDEIHRFNKAQQDAFLPRVEAGDIVLVGATTENPSFEVNAALLSRSKVFVLRGLTTDEIDGDPHARPARSGARPRRRARRWWTTPRCRPSRVYANGDARTALNLLELSVAGAPRRRRRTAPRPRADRPDDSAARAALRQVRRGALQHHLGAPQVDAQQRPRRGGLLAGAHGRGRRGSAVHRAAARAVRVRGHRQRRSAGADRRRRREGRRPLHRHARRQHGARAGRDLPGDRAEEQRGLRGLQPRRRRRAPRRRRTGAAAPAERADAS